MPRSLRLTRRRVAATTLALLAGLLVPVTQAGTAQADTAPTVAGTPTTVSADALPTVQINGVVWDQVIVGNRVYVTGNFSQARPAGAAAGTNQTARANLLAYDLTTGDLITSWAPTLNAQGLTITASAAGDVIYVGGDFTSVTGVTRNRIVALNATTGAVITGFNASANGRVRDLQVSGGTLYAGGAFTTATGVSRSRLASFALATGALTSWAPVADAEVMTITLPAGLNKVVAGGRFKNLAGSPAFGLGAVDASTGASLGFGAEATVRDAGPDAAIYSLTSSGGKVFGTGYTYLVGDADQNDGNFESVFTADAGTGALIWVSGCRGDTYAAEAIGDVVYSVGHPHDCSTIGGHPQTDPWTFQRALAMQVTPQGNTNVGGYFPGKPAPSELHWLPTLDSGSFTGQGQAAWAVTGTSKYVVLGGEFPRINSVLQQGLTRFAVTTSAPNTQGPQGQSELKPNVTSLAAGAVRVAFKTSWDRDNEQLTYEVLRGNTVASSTVLKTLTARTNWWTRPNLAFTDTTAPPGSSQSYRVRVRDAFNNSVVSPVTTFAVPAGQAQTSLYANTVIGDGATHLWRLGESAGAVGYDWAGGDDLTLDSSTSRGTAGALGNETTTATTFAGGTEVPAVNGTALTAPATFTAEAWFRTTSTSGGKIIGYGDFKNATSWNYDRHVYLTNDGKLVFGVYNGGTRTVQTGAAFNDGQWHQVVATLGAGGQSLYVDGKLRAADPGSTAGQPFTGYWRIGGDNLGGWPNQPSSNSFGGSLAEVAVYPTALSAEAVRTHFAATGRTISAPTRPADGYGRAVWDANPSLYWRLDDATGAGTALNTVTAERDANYSAGVTRQQAPAPAAPAGASVTFPGDQGTQALVSQNPVDNPRTYSLETWFRTGTNRGGRLIGFGNSSDPAQASGNYDRYIYMLDTGQLRYGIWTGTASTVDSPGAYNDAKWHHVVATQGPAGQQLFVDGALVGTGGANDPQGYTGYWRLGTDNTWGGNTSNDFAGSLDEAAVYPGVLSAAAVQQHYAFGAPATNQAPVASFTSTRTGLKVDLDASGSSDADGTVAAYAWDFGDGTAAGTGRTPSHTYAAAGTYTVKLVVTDNGGATGTFSTPVTVTAVPNQAPTAAFGSSTTNLAASFDASGSADADGTIASYAWTFGDGSSGTGKTPSHTYAAAGTFTVGLTVTDDRGASTLITHPVTVTPANQRPSAAFTADVTQRTVSLANTSTDPDGTIAASAWTFGDGGTSTATSPSHTYAAAGTYTVTLTVTDDDGATDAVSRQVVAVNPPNQKPTAAFTSSSANLTAAFDASGSADADGTITGYAWDFGDGTAAGTGRTPTHAYAAAGSYTVKLTVTDDSGETGVVSRTVTVVAANVSPTAAFTSTRTGLAASFDASTSTDPDGTIASYAWSFGDGTATGTGRTPAHTYAATGSYLVTLTVTDDDGATASTSRTVAVAAPNQAPTASFGTSVSGLTASFDASASADPDGTLAGYTWSYGDGVTATAGKTPTHTYATAGTYTVTLTVTDDGGLTGQTTRQVVTTAANQSPTAAFTATTSALTATFDPAGSRDTDGTITGYAWNFGDGTAAGSGPNPAHTYAAAGTYTVVLTVTDDKGATGTVSRPVTVAAAVPNQPPTAAFGTSTAGLVATFTDGSTDPDGTIASSAWTFGDGSTSTAGSLSHTYGAPGTYTVTLVVTDDRGATGTVSRPVTVTAPNGSTSIARDAFGRTVGTGWGSADTGGAWTLSSGTATASVSSGSAAAGVPAGKSLTGRLAGVAALESDVSATQWLTTMPTGGGVQLGTIARSTAAGDYRARVKVTADGVVAASVTTMVGGTETALGTQVNVAGISYTPGLKLHVRVQTLGSAPTTVRMRVWADGTAEPTSWTRSVTDSSAGLQVAGSPGLYAYSSASSTAAVTARFDDLDVTAAGAGPAPNVAPGAAFSVTPTDLVAAFDAGASSDPDGTIAGYAWDFGDGTAAGTGKTPSHTYAAAGSYPVKLTVTDDKGAIGTVTRSVTVTAAGTPDTLAADAFTRTVAGGWGTVPTGGAWTLAGSGVSTAVADGFAQASVPAGKSLTARLNAVSNGGNDVRATAWTTSMPTGGGGYLSVIARGTTAGDYRARVKLGADGVVTAGVTKMVGSTETVLNQATVGGLTYTAGAKLNVRVQTTGASPTTVRMKVWAAGGSEPAAWTSTASDNSAGFQVPGAVGLYAYASGSSTQAVSARFDDFSASPL